ncbi:MAG TPA: DUF5694 domain-containing protein [Pyrinomonadaceae bacterium]|nr:DUF5694 domain-containing protein [Pyrinomonadaceae bacterium]
MKLRANIFLFVSFFLILSTFAAEAQVGKVDASAKTKPTLVVLGTYRMETAGNNVKDPKAADITAPERQKQIAALVERLKKIKPTKIALECAIASDARTNDAYNQYLSGSYQLSKNETNQIGFRLAKELSHKKVYCVDSVELPNELLSNYQRNASRDAEFVRFLRTFYRNQKKGIDAEYEKLFPLSVTDQLFLLNQHARMEKEHQRYFDLLRIGREKEYLGVSFLSWWYGKNMKILTNIIKITDSPNDRVLVIYGVEHNKLLTQFAKESAFYNVESPLKYLKSRKK